MGEKSRAIIFTNINGLYFIERNLALVAVNISDQGRSGTLA